jgi:5-methylcytosine-specific restriction endonuclease McrA
MIDDRFRSNRKPPHPATLIQRKSSGFSPGGRPPHPATLGPRHVTAPAKAGHVCQAAEDRRVYRSEMTDKVVSSGTKRNELASYRDAITVETPFQVEVLLICPYCFGVMTHGGATIDHIVTPKQWEEDGLSVKLDSEHYNHESNLVVVCKACNESKGTKDLLAWWREKYHVPPRVYEVLIPILDTIYKSTSKERMTHFAFGQWKKKVYWIVDQVASRLRGT